MYYDEDVLAYEFEKYQRQLEEEEWYYQCQLQQQEYEDWLMEKHLEQQELEECNDTGQI